MPTTRTPLWNLRRARTIRQAELARLVGITQQTLSKYEGGKLTPPPDLQARLAAILGVAVAHIWPTAGGAAPPYGEANP